MSGFGLRSIDPVDADWLTLREPQGARARSRRLAGLVSAALGSRPGGGDLGGGDVVVHDLGSGTGSMMRWLAPLLPGPQRWVLHDWDEHVLTVARSLDPAVDVAARPVAVSAQVGSLAELVPSDIAGASLVTASALLDVLDAAEVHRIVDACIAVGAPALLALNVVGSVTLTPRHRLDRAIGRAFDEHQQRTVDGRRLLGPRAGGVARARFERAGWRVRSEETVWRLGPHEPELLAAWLDGWVGAAAEQRPSLPVGPYRAERGAEMLGGTLSAVVRHVDLLAVPGSAVRDSAVLS